MASRSTMTAATELMKKWQTEYPEASFRIIENSEIREVGRALAEREGYTIMEDDGSRWVLANVTRFDILEVRHCACGAEILTAAVGEYGLSQCQDCSEMLAARHAREMDSNCQIEAARIMELEIRDRQEQD